MCLERGVGFLQQVLLVDDHPVVVHTVFGKVRRSGDVVGLQQALFDQPLRTDQQGIARKRRRAGVGRKTESHGHERQHLPEPLAGLDQKVDKPIGGRSQIADPEGPRQRGRMQQNPAGTRKTVHERSESPGDTKTLTAAPKIRDSTADRREKPVKKKKAATCLHEKGQVADEPPPGLWAVCFGRSVHLQERAHLMRSVCFEADEVYATCQGRRFPPQFMPAGRQLAIDDAG